MTSAASLEKLKSGNEAYLNAAKNDGDISPAIRKDTSENGQKPYAVVVTCSDSRVPPEHIFSAGIGELFVIRTAGNVVGAFELGSIEYGAEHLGAPVVVVLGHTGCGAVAATLGGGAEGNIKHITDEISSAIGSCCDAHKAEELNIFHSREKIMESEIIKELVREESVSVVCAKYDIHSGKVEFL